MKKWFQRSLQNQLMVLILLAVILPICLLGAFSYTMANHLSKERATVSSWSSLQQLKTSVEFIVNDVNSMSVFLIGNQEVQSYTQSMDATIQQRRNISGFLANLIFSKPYIANILIEPNNNISSISYIPILNVEEDHLTYDNQNKWWSGRYRNQNSMETQDVISFVRPIRSIHNYTTSGYLTIFLDQQYLEKQLNAINFEWEGSTLILQDDFVIAGSLEHSIEEEDLQLLQSLTSSPQQTLNKKIAGVESTILTMELSDVNWKLIRVIPTKEYTAQNRKFIFLTIAVVFISLFLIAGLVIFFIRKVTRPLTRLTNTIRHAQPDQGIKELPRSNNHEVGQLLTSYNSLTSRIRQLMDKIKRQEAHKREVDLQALQAQINPHFLYNTLASIQWMALVNRDKQISTMVSSLSNVLRFSLNKGDEYCEAKQELEHLYNYVRIQQIRYPDKFELKLNFPEEIKSYHMLKLVLQPLIENSIVHGFLSNNNENGIIEVSGDWNGSLLHVKVQDNGAGMSERQIAQLNQQFIEDEKLQSVLGKHYGLRNVHLRLVLHYGSVAKLKIKSEPNKGTSITFKIPLD
ncbi:two-component system, sensor histidine kinase YesM [Gracilibacillus orientalis]|uniref:histidine kinase n=1 Tax=Gracilibacillus orientalis TaxID=334253 RepID=A0A1I4HXV2_9BACI|nr:sensor histidine kinase [Gracilibacillus orientalis]SFL46975.1 two-component system, sensor histidine kinase YesM [Gracilibacillus orientalis]